MKIHVQLAWGQPLTYDFVLSMSRPPRIEFGGAVHHAMARGDRREEIFRDDRDRLKFLGCLAEGAERYRVKVHCYVLMVNHFHLVATAPEGNLSIFNTAASRTAPVRDAAISVLVRSRTRTR